MDSEPLMDVAVEFQGTFLHCSEPLGAILQMVYEFIAEILWLDVIIEQQIFLHLGYEHINHLY